MSLKPPPTIDNDTLDLHLTVRFSASLPDLFLTISLTDQPYANTSTLKQLIRTHLPDDYRNRRIRLIYAGKALGDDTPLGASLKRTPSRPPSRTPTPAPYDDVKGKGKAPVRDPPLRPAPTRIYIHCSIGDVVLSPTELAQEITVANPTHSPSTQNAQEQSPTPPPPPAPRGFDRLLTSGFSPSEVANLRLQFLSIQSHTHTPDDMPSPTTLRNLEDQWLDDSSSLPNANPADADAVGAGTAAAGLGADEEGGALDDMIYGTMVGFFWPLGCLVWGVREEGVWSRRRKMAVVVGVLLNVGLGFLRYGR